MKTSITHKARFLLVSTTIAAGIVFGFKSIADTLTREVTTTTTTIQEVENSPTRQVLTDGPVMTGYATDGSGTYIVDFNDFDLSRDGILSANEIGEVLFRFYDTDGNALIDNIEYERRVKANITPVERNTAIYYDFDGDGDADETAYTYETFTREMPFSRFDSSGQGIAPRELTELSFNHADVNNDRFVNKDEWQRAFMPSIHRYNKQRTSLNQ